MNLFRSDIAPAASQPSSHAGFQPAPLAAWRVVSLTVLLVTFSGGELYAQADPNVTAWSARAESIYETGFAENLMKHAGGGVGLFNRDLIQNDAPGAGPSEKGPHADIVWGKVQARKVVMLRDARATRAELYVYPQKALQHPLTVVINGHTTRIANTPRKGWESIRWVQFPVEWLKTGENIIDLSCPEAGSEKEGWKLEIARADEYERGGGDPARVGETSFKSTDGGKLWQMSPFGREGAERAEYCVRISFERHVPAGFLKTPVIDLWKGDSTDFIARQRTIKKLMIDVESQVPASTSVACFFRKGTHPSPTSPEWESYEKLGTGATIAEVLDGAKFNRRYLQIKIVLATDNPVLTPVVREVAIKAEFWEAYPVPRHRNIHVVDLDNPPLRYSSINWAWEANDRPELAKLRKQENLDEVIAGSRTQYEAQIKLLDYAKKRWEWTVPRPEYPEWDAVSIVNRINKTGGGGMCIQQNLFFIGLCQAYGWQGRLVCVDAHEVAEVWSDDYGKWIYFDAYFPNHCLCDPETGEPLGMLEIHDRYLEYYYPNRAMDWATDERVGVDTIKKRSDKPRVVSSSLSHHAYESYFYTGFLDSRILRMLPRSNFIAQPFPRPVGHQGGGYYWDGYVSWYDERTPVRGQYSRHTDRSRDLWPDLNTVHVTCSQGAGNDRLFLEFETYTPSFSHFEVACDGAAWKRVEDRWTWLLVPGKNSLQVRSVNEGGNRGKPASLVVNRVMSPLQQPKNQL